MYEDDVGMRDRFIQELIRHSVVARSDLHHGVDKSFISRMKQIGEWAPYLGRPDILPRLNGGRTVFYAAALLLKSMKGAPQDRANEMAALFATVSGGVTRDFLEREIKAAPALAFHPHLGTEDRGCSRNGFGGRNALRPYAYHSRGRRLGSASAGLCRFGCHQPLLEREKVNDIKAAMVFAPLEKSPPPPASSRGAASKCVSHVLLTSSPPVPEVTDATVIITAEKRLGEMIIVPNDWALFYPHPADARVLAKQLAPNAQTNLHVFAPADAGSSDNWITIARQHDGGDDE